MKTSTTLLLVISLLILPVSSYAGEIDQFLGSRSVAGQIFFIKGNSRLTVAHKRTLMALTQALHKNRFAGRLIRVEGFSSPEGNRSVNYDLSMQRAMAVQSYLQQRGLTTELFLTGHGEKNVATAKLSEQRRVDIAIYQETRAVKQLFQNSGQIERFVIQ